MRIVLFLVLLRLEFIVSLPNRNSFSSAIAQFLGAEEQPKSITETVIVDRTEMGRMVLLVCAYKCAKHRAEIPQWLKEFNQLKKYEKTDIISYYYHTYRQPVSFINETEVYHFPNLIYFIGNKRFIFNGDVSEKVDVQAWFAKIDDLHVKEVSTYPLLNEVISDALNCTSKYILLASNEGNCPQEARGNVARVAQSYGIQPVFVSLPLDALTHVLLFKRLPQVSEHQCSMTILLYENNYSDFGDEMSPHMIAEWIELLLPPDEGDCPALLDSFWFPIKDELTELEQIYFTASLEIDERNKRPSFVLVGLTGGLAVIVLAYSIFWGLNGSAFAK